MNQLTFQHFAAWLESYGRASTENDARASAELFASDAKYYETPFSDPMVGKEAIYQYWLRGARSLKDKESSYEIFALQGDLGIARWQSTFTVIETGKRLRLDCLFLVEFNDHGKCSLFREWWHTQELQES